MKTDNFTITGRVTDHKTGDWIDAFAASYVTGETTPMDYGLGAEITSSDSALNYQQAVREIHDREERLHQKGSPLQAAKQKAN